MVCVAHLRFRNVEFLGLADFNFAEDAHELLPGRTALAGPDEFSERHHDSHDAHCFSDFAISTRAQGRFGNNIRRKAAKAARAVIRHVIYHFSGPGNSVCLYDNASRATRRRPMGPAHHLCLFLIPCPGPWINFRHCRLSALGKIRLPAPHWLSVERRAVTMAWAKAHHARCRRNHFGYSVLRNLHCAFARRKRKGSRMGAARRDTIRLYADLHGWASGDRIRPEGALAAD